MSPQHCRGLVSGRSLARLHLHPVHAQPRVILCTTGLLLPVEGSSCWTGRRAYHAPAPPSLRRCHLLHGHHRYPATSGALWTSTRHFFVRFRETPNDLCYRFEVEGATFLAVDASSASLSFTRENQHHSPLAAQLLSALPMVEEVTVGRSFVTVRKVPDGDAAAVSEGARAFVAHFERVHGAAIREEEQQMREAAKRQEQDAAAAATAAADAQPEAGVAEEKLEEGTIAELIANSTWEDLKMHVSALLTDHMYSGEPHIALDAPHPHSDTIPAEGDSEVVLAIKELVRTAIRPLLQEDGGDIRFDGFDAAAGEMRVELLGACRRCPSSRNTLQDVIERTTQHWIPEVLRVVPVETVLSSDHHDALRQHPRDDQRERTESEAETPVEMTRDPLPSSSTPPPSLTLDGACGKIEESAHAHLVRRTTGKTTLT